MIKSIPFKKIFQYKSTLLVLCILPFFVFCDLENRYPDAGEFCTPMREIPECVNMDFRNKTLFYKDNPEKPLSLRMINRVEYEYDLDNSKLQIDVVGEHRIRIRTLKFPENSLSKEETYIRMKGPKISLWTRIKKAWSKKD